MSVEMAGIEPVTATLAGRARYLSCHPRWQALALFTSTCRFHGAHAMDVSIIQPVQRLLGRSIRPVVNEIRPGGTSPGAAAGNCLLALTRQPLRRPGQPKAAAPDSCIRVASAPGERSYIHGKPMAETGQLYFRGISRCGPFGFAAREASAGNELLPLRHRPYRDLDVDAAFMLV